jgi:peptide/nickel transport system permease protein
VSAFDSVAAPDVAQPEAVAERRGPNLSLVVGGVLVALVVAAALVSFVWTPYDPYFIGGGERLAGSSAEHWMGTDRFGRDVFSRLLVGARTTLFVGVVSVGLAAVVGTPLGILMGMVSRRTRDVLTHANDLLLAFPALLLAIMFGAVFGASTATAMVAIGIATIPVFARIARGATMQVMSTEYVLAARAAGRRRIAVAGRHVLPNISSLLLVQASVSFAIAVLAEAALSFLGFGTVPPIPSWGRMLQEAQDVLAVAPMQVVWPGLGIAIAVLGFNLLGDGLRDRYDPRLAGHQ